MLNGEIGRTLGNGVRNRQLPGRENVYPAHLDFRNGALVSHGELADISNLIAPKLHADRIIQRRRENIDDAATGSVLAALSHHVYVLIGAELELADYLIKVIFMIFFEVDGSAALHFLQDGLRQAAGSRDDDLQAIEVVQNFRPAANDVYAGAQALVRQSLPCGEHGHLLPQHRRKLRREILGLAARSGYHEHWGMMSQGAQGPRPGLIQACDVEVFAHMRNHALELGI